MLTHLLTFYIFLGTFAVCGGVGLSCSTAEAALKRGGHTFTCDPVYPVKQGASGSVFKLVDPQGKTAAAKVVSFANKNERKKFNKEIEILKKMAGQPNIAPWVASTTEEDVGVLVVEFAGDETIDTYFQRPEVASSGRLQLTAAQKLLEAIRFVHQKGYVHRDLKVQNVVVDSQGEPRLIDFGISELIGTANLPVGTPGVVDPVHVEHPEAPYDESTDIYAFGILLFQALHGRTPFNALSFSEVASLTRNGDFVVPADTHFLAAYIITKCLQKQPGQRPTTLQLINLIEDSLNELADGTGYLEEDLAVSNSIEYDQEYFRVRGTAKKSSEDFKKRPVSSLDFANLVESEVDFGEKRSVSNLILDSGSDKKSSPGHSIDLNIQLLGAGGPGEETPGMFDSQILTPTFQYELNPDSLLTSKTGPGSVAKNSKKLIGTPANGKKEDDKKPGYLDIYLKRKALKAEIEAKNPPKSSTAAKKTEPNPPVFQNQKIRDAFDSLISEESEKPRRLEILGGEVQLNPVEITEPISDPEISKSPSQLPKKPRKNRTSFLAWTLLCVCIGLMACLKIAMIWTTSADAQKKIDVIAEVVLSGVTLKNRPADLEMSAQP